MQSSTLPATDSVRPIDWGLGYALSHARSLLVLALVPASVEFVSSYLLFTRPFPQQQKFLFFVVLGAANAWLISAILIGVINTVRGTPVRLQNAAAQALRYLPKVFLSYAALMSYILAVVIILPLLALAFFFIWAPGFCVGELFARHDREDANEDELNSYFDDDDLPAPRQVTTFSNKSLLELGFARSLQLGARNIGVSLQIVLIFLVCKLFPGAIVDLFTTRGMGFGPEFFRILFRYGFEAVALGIASGAFIIMLPKEARREIGLDKAPSGGDAGTSPAMFSGIRPVRVQGRKSLLLALVIVLFLSVLLLAYRMQQAHMIPPNAMVEVRKTALINEQLMIELVLEDNTERYLWLDPANFRLELIGAQSGAQSGAQPEPPGDGVSPLRKPIFFRAFDADRTQLRNDLIIPRKGVLVLQLFFERPAGYHEGEYKLYYESYFEDRRELFDGRIQRWNDDE